MDRYVIHNFDLFNHFEYTLEIIMLFTAPSIMPRLALQRLIPHLIQAPIRQHPQVDSKEIVLEDKV